MHVDRLGSKDDIEIRAELRAAGQTANGWKSLLLRGQSRSQGTAGPILGNLANAHTALRHHPSWLGVLAYNEFHRRSEALRPTPWGYTGPMDDYQSRLVADWLQHEAIGVGPEIAGHAVDTVARARIVHPVRDWLEALPDRWDRIERVGQWTTLYLGAENTEYSRAVGARFLRAAVARIIQPGCKVDSAVILEGDQGLGKSGTIAALGGDWTTDDLADFGTKECAIQLAGVWIVELGELDSLSRAEVSKIKAFMSRRVDRYRPPYGRQVIEVPRQCVFVGTTNRDRYLRDETGARRFWPLQCGRIDLASLERDRDQIWAEAAFQFRSGEPWWLDSKELVGAATEEVAKRYEADPWQSVVGGWADGRDSVTIEQVLAECIKKPVEQWDQRDRNRVGQCLRVLGWESRQKRAGGAREWRWYRRSE